jgi:uncharacterized protein YecE (DUF72 family)
MTAPGATPSLFAALEKKRDRRVSVGTSGYSFHDWVGSFYPLQVPARQQLQYYAGHFPCLEVNVTHYRLPDASLLQRMCLRTPDDFQFLVKLHRSMTHEMIDEDDVYGSFAEALKPMQEAGKLAGVLAQFPFRFRSTPTNRAFVGRLHERFPGVPLFTEYRHASWITDSWFDFLEGQGIGYVSVDEPQLRDMVPPVVRATNDTGYVRLHGRNEQAWYSSGPEQGDRYDYHYSESELLDWAKKIRQLMDETRRVFVLFNNCHAGQAPANAQAMQQLLEDFG